MQHVSDSEFKYGDLCLFRRRDVLEAQILRILAPTGGSVGGRTLQPGGKLSPPAPSHWHYHTDPPIAEGAWGQYLTKVPTDFGGQLAVFLEQLAHDPAIINHWEKVAGQTARLNGADTTGRVVFPVQSLLPWHVWIADELIATVTEPFSRKALQALAICILERLAVSIQQVDK